MSIAWEMNHCNDVEDIEDLYCKECEDYIFPVNLKECKEEWGIDVECECSDCGYTFINGV